MSIEVAVVAIAKDEGAYIHEWIHHYLYFGFTRIIIGVNRTTDLTPKIIEKISSQYPQVTFIEVDWIDQGSPAQKNPQFQALSYAYLSNLIKQRYIDITHILYADVDEFWFSHDFNLDVRTFLNSLPTFDMLSFSWLWQNGDSQIFEKPFKNLKVRPDIRMKSLIPISTLGHIVEFRCHASKMDKALESFKHLDANGILIEYGEHDQLFSRAPTLATNAFMLHRVCRSEVEYVAMLARERPGVALPFKNNRFGFSEDFSVALKLENSYLEKYWSSLSEFIVKCAISPFIATSKESVIKKAERLLEKPGYILAGNVVTLLQLLKGTSFQSKVLTKLESFGSDILKDEFARGYFDAGLMLEKNKNLDQSVRYLRLANASRPNGPVIKQNLERLESLLARLV